MGTTLSFQLQQQQERLQMKDDIIDFFILTGADLALKRNNGLYQQIRKIVDKNDKISEDILKDTPRTLPRDNIDIRLHQQKLFYILRAYAYLYPRSYYSQGMNYVASFCLNMFKEDEEKAFFLFIEIMQKYGSLFQKCPRTFHQLVDILTSIVQRKLPHLLQHLENNCIDIIMVVPRWFHTLYAHDLFPFSMSLKIWQLIIQPGLEGWIHFIQIAAYILEALDEQVRRIRSTEEILIFFQTPQLWGINIPQQLSLWQNKKEELSNEETLKLKIMFDGMISEGTIDNTDCYCNNNYYFSKLSDKNIGEYLFRRSTQSISLYSDCTEVCSLTSDESLTTPSNTDSC